jgi:hypothetical protein
VQLKALPVLGAMVTAMVTSSPHGRFADHSSLIFVLSTLGRIERAGPEFEMKSPGGLNVTGPNDLARKARTSPHITEFSNTNTRC